MPTRRLAVLLLALLLVGCAGLRQPGAERENLETEAEELADSGEHAAAAERYAELVTRSEGRSRADAALAAAEQWLEADRLSAAEEALGRTERMALDGAQRSELAILRSEILLRQGRAERALAQLPAIDQGLPEHQARQVLALEAQAHGQLGEPTAALRSLLRRHERLDEPSAREANDQRIWTMLQETGAELPDDPPEDLGEMGLGWIELARIHRSRWQRPERVTDSLDAWRERFPHHRAGRTLLPRLQEAYRELRAYPQRVGLLLPLSGRFKGAAGAIRDGFMTGYYGEIESAGAVRIHVYDTSGGIDAALRAAHADAVEFLVGPLAKEAVGELAEQGPDVPVLALNQHSAGAEHLYQFGLSPEDEARQVAERAILDGRERAIALIPATEWGRRVRDAFAERYEQLGGRMLDSQAYPEHRQDFSLDIKALLRLDESEARRRALASTLERSLAFEPRRRQDPDMIFLGAFPRQARLIKPQLRFHRAAELPVYATSHVYSGHPSPGKDQDLDGIIFPDMPWRLRPEDFPARARMAKLWGDRFRSRNDLFALGYDAFRLIPVLDTERPGFSGYFPGVTGQLYLEDERRILRKLEWAQFRRGRPTSRAVEGER